MTATAVIDGGGAVTTLRVLSLGGGTQSCALALMSARGDLPKLDHIVFADTQGELPETYEYLDYLRGIVEAAGIPLHVVTAGSLEQALLATESTSANPTPPSHVLKPDGTKGRVGDYRCSYDFKRRVVDRHVKKLCGGRGAWKRATVEQWIGYSTDEMARMKPADQCRCGHNRTVRRKGHVEHIHTTTDGCTRCACPSFDPWQTNRWPLIELRMRREDTIAWFARHGYRTPGRSSCTFCPNSSNERWQYLRDNHPDRFERACVLDERIRMGTPLDRRLDRLEGQLFLHETLVPLRDADLRTKRQRLRDQGVMELFDVAETESACDAGVCFT